MDNLDFCIWCDTYKQQLYLMWDMFQNSTIINNLHKCTFNDFIRFVYTNSSGYITPY